ncbi:hypothetical protein PR048_030594 [Dryococelus australis]|uniref:Uncharacterized protein n=1 Tax=Dryococelus australis TaxID=614101 RepID=A0ABQ9G9V1_9NEOP|nr:hypothetical protein PR048_030594 [Dryococelus australis]
MISKSGGTVWHCSSESIVHIQNSITPFDCQRIKEYVTLSEDYEASRVVECPERVNVDVFAQNKQQCPQHSYIPIFFYGTIKRVPMILMYEKKTHFRRAQCQSAHRSSVQRLARWGEGASGMRDNVALIAPVLLCLKRAKIFQVGGAFEVCTRRRNILELELQQGFRKLRSNREWIIQKMRYVARLGTTVQFGGSVLYDDLKHAAKCGPSHRLGLWQQVTNYDFFLICVVVLQNGYVHIKGTASLFQFCTITYSEVAAVLVVRLLAHILAIRVRSPGGVTHGFSNVRILPGRCGFSQGRFHHRGSKLDLRSYLRASMKTVAPFEFRAGLKIEIKFISNRRNWRFEISIRDQHPSSTNIKLDSGSELGSFDLGSGAMLVKPALRNGNEIFDSSAISDRASSLTQLTSSLASVTANSCHPQRVKEIAKHVIHGVIFQRHVRLHSTCVYVTLTIGMRTMFDSTWRTLTQSSPSTVTADNQCAVKIGKFIRKTVESSLQVVELTNFQSQVRSGDDELDVCGNVALITPALLRLKREKHLQRRQEAAAAPRRPDDASLTVLVSGITHEGAARTENNKARLAVQFCPTIKQPGPIITIAIVLQNAVATIVFHCDSEQPMTTRNFYPRYCTQDSGVEPASH